MSRRGFDGAIKAWRRKLHEFGADKYVLFKMKIFENKIIFYYLEQKKIVVIMMMIQFLYHHHLNEVMVVQLRLPLQ
jgi:hypothetical protein